MPTYKKSISTPTNIELCKFLLSPYKEFGLSWYKKASKPPIIFADDNKKVRNRLDYLQKLDKSAFLDLCKQYEILPQYSDEEASEEEEDLSDDEVPPRTTTTTTRKVTKTMSTKAAKNDVGDKIVIETKRGIYMVMIWVDSNMNEKIIQFKIEKKKVIKRSKKPSADITAKVLLQEMGKGYEFAKDDDNAIVTELSYELSQIQQRRKDTGGDEWDEETLFELDEEVLPSFVDYKGHVTDNIDYHQDKDGRQRICFFLKALSSMTEKKKNPKFTKSGVPASVSVDEASYDHMSDDDDDDEENNSSKQDSNATALREELREEMKHEMKQFSTSMMAANEKMMEMMMERISVGLREWEANTLAPSHGMASPDAHRSA